jgi:hypothetical protein
MGRRAGTMLGRIARLLQLAAACLRILYSDGIFVVRRLLFDLQAQTLIATEGLFN